MMHLRNVHSRDKNKNDSELKDGGHIEKEEQKAENEQSEEEKDESAPDA